MLTRMCRAIAWILVAAGFLCLSDPIRSLAVSREAGELYWAWVAWGFTRTSALQIGLALLFVGASIQLLASRKYRSTYAAVCIPSILAILGFEFYATYLWGPSVYDLQDERAAAARRLGIPFDTRTALDMVKLPENIAAAASFPAAVYLTKVQGHDGLPVLPLAHWPKRRMLSCNENGYWAAYVTDRFGFNNEDKVWDSPSDVMVVGDSFGDGACVHRDEGWVAVLSRSLPTVFLGLPGNGPLSKLALVREFIGIVRPKVVLVQLYMANDLTDIPREMGLPTLSSYYRDPSFTQQTATRQAEAKVVLDKLYAEYLTRVTNERQPTSAALQVPVLPYTRDMITKAFNRITAANIPLRGANGKNARMAEEANSYREVRLLVEMMERVRDLSTAHGARVLIALLPAHEEVRWRRPLMETQIAKDALAVEGFTVFDLLPTFLANPQPLDLFPFGLRGHYSAKGHALVGQTLAAESERIIRTVSP